MSTIERGYLVTMHYDIKMEDGSELGVREIRTVDFHSRINGNRSSSTWRPSSWTTSRLCR